MQRRRGDRGVISDAHAGDQPVVGAVEHADVGTTAGSELVVPAPTAVAVGLATVTRGVGCEDLLRARPGAVILMPAHVSPARQVAHLAGPVAGAAVSLRRVRAEEDDQLQLERDPAGLLVVSSAPRCQHSGECGVVKGSLGFLEGIGVGGVQRQNVLPQSCVTSVR